MAADGHTIVATRSNDSAIAVVAILLSAGGLNPLRRIVQGLRTNLPAAFVIAQHVHQRTVLPEILSLDTRMPVALAASGLPLRPARIYVCPAAQHLAVSANATLTVSDGARLGYFRPNGDWLFESAAASFRERTFAVVLSGLQNDGACGVKAVRDAGGTVIVQDPADCEHPQMPSAAIATNVVDHIVAHDQIAELLNTKLAILDAAVLERLRPVREAACHVNDRPE